MSIIVAIIGSAPRKDGSSKGYPNSIWVCDLVKKLNQLVKAREWDYDDLTIISGGAEGPDTWAVDTADRLGIETKVYAADWETHKKAAGPIRNTEIAKQCDALVAFWDGKSSGTQDCFYKAIKANKPVWIIGPTAQPFDASYFADSILRNAFFFKRIPG